MYATKLPDVYLKHPERSGPASNDGLVDKMAAQSKERPMLELRNITRPRALLRLRGHIRGNPVLGYRAAPLRMLVVPRMTCRMLLRGMSTLSHDESRRTAELC